MMNQQLSMPRRQVHSKFQRANLRYFLPIRRSNVSWSKTALAAASRELLVHHSPAPPYGTIPHHSLLLKKLEFLLIGGQLLHKLKFSQSLRPAFRSIRYRKREADFLALDQDARGFFRFGLSWRIFARTALSYLESPPFDTQSSRSVSFG